METGNDIELLPFGWNSAIIPYLAKSKFGYQADILRIKFCKVKFLCVCVWVLRAIGLLSFVCKIFPSINIADTAAQ